MTSGSLKLGRLAGIAVNLHWSVAHWRAVLLVRQSEFGPRLDRSSHRCRAVHDLDPRPRAGTRLGGTTVRRRHRLDRALGTRRDRAPQREAPSPKAEGSIAVAGPLASLLIGVIGLAAYFTLGSGSATVAGVAGWVGIINVMLAVFNMLPGAPLDGGRVVKALRWKRHGNRHRATREPERPACTRMDHRRDRIPLIVCALNRESGC